MLLKKSTLIVAPSNLVLDDISRKLCGLEVEGKVLIFDNAHEVVQVCVDLE